MWLQSNRRKVLSGTLDLEDDRCGCGTGSMLEEAAAKDVCGSSRSECEEIRSLCH